VKVAGALVIALTLSPLKADMFKDVEYLHTVNGKAERVRGQLLVDATAETVAFQSKQVRLEVASQHVTNVIYEQTSKPRYAEALLLWWPLVFTKSKQHYLTLQYNDRGAGKYAIFLLHSNFREVLAATEAALGRKVERFEER